jgi:thiol-disulfide isomerase/thioredoxin
MNQYIRSKLANIRTSVTVAVLVLGAGATQVMGAVSVGGIAPDFTVRNHATGQPFRLYNYQGHIIVLDFWAYWCGPCMSAAADLEPNVVQYYRNRCGNQNGVPVQVISVSIDLSDLTAANNFIQTYGLELVGDDTTGAAYNAYGNGYIPYFVVVNGTTNASNYRSWEVLYSAAGYASGSTVPSIKAKIDSVQTPTPVNVLSWPLAGSLVPPSEARLTATVDSKGKIIKKVEFYDGTALIGSITNATQSLTNRTYSLTWAGAPLGTRNVSARAHYGTSSLVNSTPVSFTVGLPTPIETRMVSQGGSLVLSWSGSPGLFRVQRSTNLSNQAWEYVTDAATNTSIAVNPAQSAAFYRVVRP